jgi:hypothetical protein
VEFGAQSGPLFAEQIPAPDPDAIVAGSSRKAEDWERMEWRFIRRANRIGKIVAHRVSTEKLADLDDASSWQTLPTAPTFGGGNWYNSLVADREGNRLRNEEGAKCMD